MEVTPALRTWLGGRGRGPRTTESGTLVFSRLFFAAGVKWGHDILRHSFTSDHLLAHPNAALTAPVLGHSNGQMRFAHYRKLVPRESALTWWELRPAQKPSTTVPVGF
jgi:integrase